MNFIPKLQYSMRTKLCSWQLFNLKSFGVSNTQYKLCESDTKKIAYLDKIDVTHWWNGKKGTRNARGLGFEPCAWKIPKSCQMMGDWV